MSQESLEELLMKTAMAVSNVREFAEKANCGDIDPELFFNTETSNQLIPMEVLKACLGCKVRLECLERIATLEVEGRYTGVIYGGMKGSARKQLLYKMPKHQWLEISREYIQNAIDRRKNYRVRKRPRSKKDTGSTK